MISLLRKMSLNVSAGTVHDATTVYLCIEAVVNRSHEFCPQNEDCLLSTVISCTFHVTLVCSPNGCVISYAAILSTEPL